jgi:7-carboxy-7-deazaguanine synthase
MNYPVNDCYTCVQGEGVLTGVAMVLLRLHGCAVGCPWCDTKETWEHTPEHEQASITDALGSNPKYTLMSAAAIANHIRQNHPGPVWILLTGGEPAQYPLKPLIDALHSHGYKVALETSGTEVGHLDAGIDWVCVSPKIDMPGGKAVLPAAGSSADEIKHVVGRQGDIDALDVLLAANRLKESVQLCLQPVSTSQKATALCLETVQTRGWRLSIQMHKYIGVS